ncbi:MAG: hypothetical protein ABIQ52_19815 [Vicinamibacterales bacterium]
MGVPRNTASPALVISAVLGGLGLVACSRSAAVPPPSQPQPEHAMGHAGASGAAPIEVLNLSGRERFGWTQSADSLAGYKFAVYADGTRAELPDAVCQPPVGRQAECVAALPPLASGRHRLEIVSWTLKDGRVIESARSSTMTIEILGSPTTPSKDH